MSANFNIKTRLNCIVDFNQPLCNDAIAFAANVAARWTKAKAGQSRTGEAGARPTAAEIEEALRALLATDPNGPDFPRAWALFVELRQIDREATAG